MFALHKFLHFFIQNFVNAHNVLINQDQMYTPSLHNSIVTNEDTFLFCKQQSNHSMLGVHASAWAIIHYGYIARKQNLTGVCLDWLSRFVWTLCDRLYDRL